MSNEDDIEMRFGVDVKKDTPRMCPKCKSVGEEDYINTIKIKIEDLTKTKTILSCEIDMLTKELETKIQFIERQN